MARLYVARVSHRRLVPVMHAFRYRVFGLLLDVDRIDAELGPLALVSHNRFNLLAFHDRDHGPGDGSPLRPWLEQRLAEHGFRFVPAGIELMCFPRVLGYVFNPLALWFCRDRRGRLRAVVCEVSNTFGQRHCYVLGRHPGDPGWRAVRRVFKQFHVSPFLPPRGAYRFRFHPPAGRVGVTIEYRDDHRVVLQARLAGTALALTDGALAGQSLRTPLMTLKVIAMIHWQALRLYLRGVPVHPRPSGAPAGSA